MKIPQAGDLIHDRQGVQKVWVGVLFTMDKGVPYTMNRGFDVPWLEDSIYHGEGFEIPCVGVPNTMGKGLITMFRGFEIPWIRGSIYHG